MEKAMKRKLLCALLAAMGVSATFGVGAATVVHETNEYTVTYDDDSFFGIISSWGGDGSTANFTWSFPKDVSGNPLASVQITNGSVTSPYVLGSFTLQAKAGYVLQNLNSTAGGAFAKFSDAAVSATMSGSLAFDDGPSTSMVPLPTFSPALGSIGLWTVDTINASGDHYTKVVVSGVTYTLSANASVGSFAGILGDPDKGPKFSFGVAAAPVPEPETYALMLAGLGLVGLAARRRKRA